MGVVATAGISLSQPARAQTMQWNQIVGVRTNGTTFKACDLKVGPNNVPWALSCGPAPDTDNIYYMSPTQRSCQGILCRPVWVTPPSNGRAPDLTIDLEGHATVTTGSQIWLLNGDGHTPEGPGGWNGPFNTTILRQGACLTSIAQTLDDDTPTGVMFKTAGDTGGAISFTVWGIGCGGNPNAAIYRLDTTEFVDIPNNTIALNNTQWQQVGASEANAAKEITLFSDVNGNGVIQNPWIYAQTGQTEGLLFVFDGEQFQFVSTPEDITYVTDHYVVGASGQTYFWNGTALGQGNTTWTLVAGTAHLLAPIAQIAWSNAIPNTVNGTTIGPSQLWAIDTAGNVYEAGPTPGNAQ